MKNTCGRSKERETIKPLVSRDTITLFPLSLSVTGFLLFNGEVTTFTPMKLMDRDTKNEMAVIGQLWSEKLNRSVGSVRDASRQSRRDHLQPPGASSRN